MQHATPCGGPDARRFGEQGRGALGCGPAKKLVDPQPATGRARLLLGAVRKPEATATAEKVPKPVERGTTFATARAAKKHTVSTRKRGEPVEGETVRGWPAGRGQGDDMETILGGGNRSNEPVGDDIVSRPCFEPTGAVELGGAEGWQGLEGGFPLRRRMQNVEISRVPGAGFGRFRNLSP
jgi:hypothetical protein